MRGDRSARREARLMVAEKLDAAFEANVRMLECVVGRYNLHVSKARRGKRQADLQTQLRPACPQTPPAQVAF